MEKFYRHSIEQIKNFYTEKIDESNAETKIFEILKSIIPFECGKIFYLNGEEKNLIYSCKSGNPAKFVINKTLFAGEIPFGLLQLERNSEFSSDEITVLETCASVIAGLIKDIEMNSIVKAQLYMLQEGIQAKSNENRKILQEDKIKNNFISNVSHELRSPLNSIIGFTDLLYSQFAGELNEKQLEYVDDIRIAGIHLLSMVNEILDMSKIESGTMRLNPRKFLLKTNADEVINILKPLYMKKSQQVFVNIGDNLEVTADYQKIQQILFNISSNAIKFTPEYGKIEISASQSLKYVTISVKDNGCGIEKKFHKKIFNKFTQIAEVANSTGLGLAITGELVKLHRGSISVKSEPNQGSEFIIKLPIV